MDFESVDRFQKSLTILLRENPSSIITLDLYKLEFVGSSGIGFFIDTIKNMPQRSLRIKISNMKSEFYRIFKTHGNELLDIIDENNDSIESSHLKRDKLFQN